MVTGFWVSSHPPLRFPFAVAGARISGGRGSNCRWADRRAGVGRCGVKTRDVTTLLEGAGWHATKLQAEREGGVVVCAPDHAACQDAAWCAIDVTTGRNLANRVQKNPRSSSARVSNRSLLGFPFAVASEHQACEGHRAGEGVGGCSPACDAALDGLA